MSHTTALTPLSPTPHTSAMNAFFATFSAADSADSAAFIFNPKTQPELELRRLQTLLNWDRASASYSQVYRDFLCALVEETKAPVHTYFVQHFPDFNYDSRGSPRAEFQRVCVQRGWRSGSRPYKRFRRLFVEAFDQEFDSDLDEFFKQFKTFDYNPRNEPKAEFERLRVHKKWKKKYGKTPAEEVPKREYQAVRDEFFEAFVGVFSYYFGLSGDYHNWEYLCGLLGVLPVPETAEACEKALDHFHVNIYNLLDHVQEQTPIIFFPDLDALTAYSWGKNPKNVELVYPLHAAQGNSLKYLLRRIGRRPEQNP